MALEGANLISSTYNGNDNDSLNTYNKLYQQQALKRAAEQKSLTEELSKLDTNGLRAQDMDNYVNKHNDWKNAAIAADKERDPTKKAKLLIDADKYHLVEKQYLQASKDEKAGSIDYGRRLLDPTFRDKISQEGVDQYQKNRTLSISDANFQGDYSKFAFKPDLSKVQSILDNTDKNLHQYRQQASSKPEMNMFTMNGVPTTGYSYKMGVDPKRQYNSYSMDFDLNQGLRDLLRSQNPKLDWDNNPEQAKQQALIQLVKDRDLSTYTDPRIEQKQPKTEKGDDNIYTGQPTTQRFSSKTKIGVDSKGGNIYKDGYIQSDNFVPQTISGAKALNQISSVYNTRTGETKTVDFTEKADVTGFGYFPNSQNNSGKETDRRFVMSVISDGDRYLIPERDIPYSIKSSKGYKNAKGIADRFENNINANKTQPKISNSDKEAMDWLKANPKAKQAEAIRKALKAKGL